MSKRGLGKGLDALLSTSSLAREKQQLATKSEALSAEGQLTELRVAELKPGVYQPRKSMSSQALEELSASIQSQGVIQPIVVRQCDDGRYEIIAGERRWRAAKHAGLSTVPCVIKQIDDRAAIAMALIENIQREDLNVIEEATALARLQKEFDLTHQQLADTVGKSRTGVTNLLRLNHLEDDVKTMVSEKQMEMGHARALLALQGQAQVALAKQVVAKHMTVRQTEQAVKKALQPDVAEEREKAQATKPEATEQAQHWSAQLANKLQAKVLLDVSEKGSSTITISLDKQQNLENILEKLAKIQD